MAQTNSGMHVLPQDSLQYSRHAWHHRAVDWSTSTPSAGNFHEMGDGNLERAGLSNKTSITAHGTPPTQACCLRQTSTGRQASIDGKCGLPHGARCRTAEAQQSIA